MVTGVPGAYVAGWHFWEQVGRGNHRRARGWHGLNPHQEGGMVSLRFSCGHISLAGDTAAHQNVSQGSGSGSGTAQDNHHTQHSPPLQLGRMHWGEPRPGGEIVSLWLGDEKHVKMGIIPF